MPFDVLSAGLGLVAGVLATLFVREIAFRNVQNQEHSKLTAHWSLADGGRAVKLCAERLGDVELPQGSQVVVRRGTPVPPEVARRCDVRVSDRIQSNFALGDGKALVFAAAPRPGSLAVWTYEAQVLQRLALEWDHAWQHSEPLAAKASVTGLKDLTGQTVEVTGPVTEVAERGGVHYLRLMEHGYTATVASANPVEARKGMTVRAVGVVERDVTGREPVLRAQAVEVVREASLAAR